MAWNKPPAKSTLAESTILGSHEWPALTTTTSTSSPHEATNRKAQQVELEVKLDGYSSDHSTTYEETACSDGTRSSCSTPEEASRLPLKEAACCEVDGAELKDTALATAPVLGQLFPELFAAAQQQDALSGRGPPGLRLPLRSAAQAFVPTGSRTPAATTLTASETSLEASGTCSAPTTSFIETKPFATIEKKPPLDFMPPPPGLRKPLRANALAFVPRSTAVVGA
mmetsp:Transcript_43816/g.103602  ORF Transcript_43816/g.103602 Transcript_43816/m.103602 type:complete len:226 (+) Transcript_43816:188-865(+)